MQVVNAIITAMEELKLCLHAHTRYSDGSGSHDHIGKAALKAGVDAVIVTDHNIWVREVEGYYQKGKKRALLLVGEEVHDPTLSKGKNHLMIFNVNRELAKFSADPQRLINQIISSNGLSFIAHPIDDPLPQFNEESFSWLDWDVNGYTGIELWNQLSEFKTRSSTFSKALFHALFPQYMTLGPLERTLKLWDELLAKSKAPVVAVAGNDAHANPVKAGAFSKVIFPYEFQFRALNNHLIVPTKLTGEITADRRMIYEALAKGRLFMGYDLPHSTNGFRFSVNHNDGQFWMGDTVKAESGMTFQVRLPRRTHVRLIKDGRVIKEHDDREVLTYISKEPGIYRVEAYIDYLGRHRGWIFSNPIYAV